LYYFKTTCKLLSPVSGLQFGRWWYNPVLSTQMTRCGHYESVVLPLAPYGPDGIVTGPARGSACTLSLIMLLYRETAAGTILCPGNQSARHPPLCATRDVERRVCTGYSLNPAAAIRLGAFDLFLSQGSNAHTIVRLRAANTPTGTAQRKKKMDSLVVTATESYK
jgi:hypothetical protein